MYKKECRPTGGLREWKVETGKGKKKDRQEMLWNTGLEREKKFWKYTGRSRCFIKTVLYGTEMRLRFIMMGRFRQGLLRCYLTITTSLTIPK
jgi:hypothetical protein